MPVEPAEDRLLQFEVFEDRFDHQIGPRNGAGQVRLRLDPGAGFLRFGRLDQSPAGVVGADPRAGVVETFIDNLPGFPDGISTGSDGVFWLAIYAPRNDLLDDAAPTPWLRRVIYRVPEALKPKPKRHPFVLGLDQTGKIVHNLQDSEGRSFSKSTSAEQYGDVLYIGSLTEPAFGRFDLSTLD